MTVAECKLVIKMVCLIVTTSYVYSFSGTASCKTILVWWHENNNDTKRQVKFLLNYVSAA